MVEKKERRKGRERGGGGRRRKKRASRRAEGGREGEKCALARFKGENRGLPGCLPLMVATQQKAAGALSDCIEQPWLHPFPSSQNKLLKGRLSTPNDRHSTMWGFWLLLFWGECEFEWGKGGMAEVWAGNELSGEGTALEVSNP